VAAITPQQFAQRWMNTPLRERQSYQIHFNEVCDLVGHERPSGSGTDSQGRAFGFEYGVKKDSGGQGFADVFYEGHFAIEYKSAGKYKSLDDAYQQLLQYREKLKNPPLLVVTDIDNWEIHTNWPNTEKKVYKFTNADIANRPSVFRMLVDLFNTPERLHPSRNTEQVTTDAAEVFRIIAEDMRNERAADAQRIAHFLTKLVFCLFAEDVNLLPPGPKGDAGIFAEIIDQTRREPSRFRRYAGDLFQAMAEGGEVLFQKIPYFNGSLFDDVTVEELSIEALGRLEQASNLNWESVEPAIFGTLFERSLDPSKRAQLGAHYTSREDILLIVEPVLMGPLRRQWEAVKAEAAPIRAKLDAATTPKDRIAHANALTALRETMLKRLREIRVLDPACGSGNFLYVALQRLMDLEKEVITHELFEGLTLALPEVHPRQMYGIEKDPIAHDLASIVVWIGYLQWRGQNGYATLTRREPILEALSGNIRQMDAIMNEDGTEPDWPEVDVIIGNPPFLGGNRIRAELGDDYVDNLFKLYEGRVPAFADLVAYWFEKARDQIMRMKAGRAGLLATNSIRGGVNREVLKRIKYTGDIFMAWSDRAWVLDGAAVRVSMVGFDNAVENSKTLDGLPVTTINADLTASVDITAAARLTENAALSFIGPQKDGPLDIPNELAQSMLKAVNPSGVANSEILKPYLNGSDIVDHSRNYWIVDFGARSEQEAAQYQAPFKYVEETLKPIRAKNRDRQRRENWWRLGRSGGDYRNATASLSRQIFTPRVAKHRIFSWVSSNTFPDSAVVAIARDDDYFFGVLHSRLHEVWSLRMGTWLGKGNDPRYTPTTTFETFPFPWPPGQEDTNSPAYRAISAAAKQLHEERAAWLSGSDSPSPRVERGIGGEVKNLKDRTLTNLYNALNVWRGREKMKVKDAAADFAPRLADLHDALDKAVCDAYGWPHEILNDDEEILRRLLALNLERAAAQGSASPSP
jgi:type II restriction/modification system DNA methylase subunit YeeA